MEMSSSNLRILILVIGITIFVLLWIVNVYVILNCTRSTSCQLKPHLDCSGGLNHLSLSYAELVQATHKFSSAKQIGEGRYGCVYKGILSSGREVAVKVLKLQRRGASKSFVAECVALRNTRHRNLVKIFTACSGFDFKGNEFKALVFEFMPNGSLESWLHPSTSLQLNSGNLSLIQRLNIAIDVASAFDYLHNHCTPPIIHCDLKPSNILLDSELCAHVGDFGLARFLTPTTRKFHYMHSNASIGVRGTIGYVAPEYGMGGEVTTQGDVYSYGILLLEMFTRKRPTESMFMDNFSLHNYVKFALPDRVMEIVDPLLVLEAEYESTRTAQKCLGLILRIGVVCSAQLPRERKGIRDVLVQLNVIRNYFLGSESEKLYRGIRKKEYTVENEALVAPYVVF